MNNLYTEQRELLINYFQNEEKENQDFLLGIEIEHFIVKDNLQAVSFFENDGIEDILQEMLKNEWSAVREKEYLVGLEKNDMSITLEPGGQLEVSIAPRKSINAIKNIYLAFLKEIIPILNNRNRLLINLGYQPVSKIEEIPLLPKKRYRYMYDYFKSKGKFAHNMMKGTAAVHVSLDYKSEADFIKKCQVTSFLAPMIYVMFDNSPFFENDIFTEPALRARIWAHVEGDRCGPLPAVFSGEFGYGKYADYILNLPPLILKEEGELYFKPEKTLKELLVPGQTSTREIEYLLTMVFPEIRIKNCLEIRIADSLPFPYNLGYLSFWRGLLYYEENLHMLYSLVQEFQPQDIYRLRKEIISKGSNANIRGKKLYNFFGELLEHAQKGVQSFDEEPNFMDEILTLFSEGQVPATGIRNNLIRGKKEALADNILNFKQDINIE